MKKSATAGILTYAGATPFVAAAALLITGKPQVLQYDIPLVLQVYSALIVSFLAGMHWHIGMTESEGQHNLLWISNAVVLAAWVTVFVPSAATACLIFALLFGGLVLMDRSLFHRSLLPPWFYRLRVHISGIVIVTLTTTAAVLWFADSRIR